MSNTVTVPANPPSEGSERLSASLPKGVWVFADQAVASVTNFLTTVFVGRLAGQEQLGFYFLAWSIFLVAFGLAKAMVWTPYTKQLHHYDDGRQAAYTGSVTVHIGFFCLAFTLLVLVGGSITWLSSPQLGTLLMVLAPCGALMLLREHIRRICLASLSVVEVFLFDIAILGVHLVGLVWLMNRGLMSAQSALIVMGIACSLSFVWMRMRREEIHCEKTNFWPDWLLNWRLSKWLSAGALSVLLGKHGYSWLLPMITNMAELGKFGSAQQTLQFANPILLGISNYLGPTSAKTYADKGIQGLWRATLVSSIIAGLVTCLFLALIGIVGEQVVQLIYQESASGVTRLLLLSLGLGMLMEVMLIPVEFASVNRGLGRLMMWSALLRLAINVTIGFALVWKFGAIGIGLGTAIGGFLALVWHWISLIKEVRHAH